MWRDMMKRFEIIVDCQGNTDLIDTENRLMTIPLKCDWDKLTDYERRRLQEWLDYLNK